MSKKRTTEDFVKQATAIHNGKYDYSISIYIAGGKEIEIICPIHGPFWQIASNHLQGHGCKKCAGNTLKSLDEFIVQANLIHNGLYDYSKVIYLGNKDDIEIICPLHEPFWQRPAHHLDGVGCPKCIGRNKSTEDFILQAIKVHGNSFDYSKAVYIGWSSHLEIICPKHGSFWQTPNNHLRGRGCRKCSRSTSKMETAWLDYIGVPNEYRGVKLIIGEQRIKPDAYDPITNTIYEFYGNYWHGNPSMYQSHAINGKSKKTFGELYSATMAKEKLIMDAGYNLITIWENNFNRLLLGH